MFQRGRRRQPPDVALVGTEFFRRGPIRVTERWLFSEAGVFEIGRIEEVHEFRQGRPWTGWVAVVLAAAGAAFSTGAGLLPGGSSAQRACLVGVLLVSLSAAALAIAGKRPAVQLFTVEGGVPRVLANVSGGGDARRIRRALAEARRVPTASPAVEDGR